MLWDRRSVARRLLLEHLHERGARAIRRGYDRRLLLHPAAQPIEVVTHRLHALRLALRKCQRLLVRPLQ